MKIRDMMIISGASAFILLAGLATGGFSNNIEAAAETHEGERHEEHEDHKRHEEDIVRLSEEKLREFGVETSVAGPGELSVYVTLPGEVKVNADRQAHVVPRVSGIVREVRKNLGDHVKAGEVMAVIESRELSDAKAEYLASRERLDLAKANYKREERLWKKKISPEQDYLSARQALAEARINLRSAEQKLHALGFSDEYLKKLPEQPDASFTRYEITAPFEGTVIEKHIALGEAIKEDASVFIVADLSRVWVDLSVYQKDLPYVREGAKTLITAGHGVPGATGVISYVGPIVGEQTRTALARVVLSNSKGVWRPGLFVNGKIEVDQTDVSLVVPKTALQTFENKTVVFVKTDDGFEPTPVAIGRSDKRSVEVLSGITQGQMYVSKGAFTLKSELMKESFSGHGHSH